MCFALLFCIVRTWVSHTLQVDPRAVCSDGSPSHYLLNEHPGSTRWLFFLPGGAACNNQVMCEDRRHNYEWLTTSSYEIGEELNGDGIFNRDCQKNPLFC